MATATPSSHSGLLYAMWLPAIAFALAGIGTRKSKRQSVLVCLLGVLLFGGLFLQTSCSGGSPDPVGSRGTPKGQYTITVTGASGSLQHPTTVVLTVQ